MGKLFVFMGKSASGKDTLYREILKQNPAVMPVIPYTTRPVRAGEIQGKEYHFVTEAMMRQMESMGKIVERRCYETVRGDWYYFTAEDGQIDFEKGNYALISTLKGYEKIRDFYGGENVVPWKILPDCAAPLRGKENKKIPAHPRCAGVFWQMRRIFPKKN